MKSEIIDAGDVPDFPKLMTNGTRDLVVLFYKSEHGVVVSGSQYWDIGEHSTGWNMSSFVEFDGEVTLSN